MKQGFVENEVRDLLVACHRRCCVCHRFCGVKMEVDHIVPRADGGGSDIGNAIALCFECHAEVHGYNDKHPRGRKFKPDELVQHREQWVRICKETPWALVDTLRQSGVGPVQALIDELEFNRSVAADQDASLIGCGFRDDQFSRTVHQGSLAFLHGELKTSVIDAYRAIGLVTHWLQVTRAQPMPSNGLNRAQTEAQRSLRPALVKIDAALAALVKFMKREEDGA